MYDFHAEVFIFDLKKHVKRDLHIDVLSFILQNDLIFLISEGFVIFICDVNQPYKKRKKVIKKRIVLK